MVPERCDERESGSAGGSLTLCKVQHEKSAPERVQATITEDEIRRLILQKPQLREIPFEIKIFERYSRTEKALVYAIIESYLQGVSKQNVETVISHMEVNQLSASYVSKVAHVFRISNRYFFSFIVLSARRSSVQPA